MLSYLVLYYVMLCYVILYCSKLSVCFGEMGLVTGVKNCAYLPRLIRHFSRKVGGPKKGRL